MSHDSSLKSNVPIIILSSPEKDISGERVKTQILRCLNKLKECDFNMCGIVCYNHSSNVSAYKTILDDNGDASIDLFMISPRNFPFLIFKMKLTLSAVKLVGGFPTKFMRKSVSSNTFKSSS